VGDTTERSINDMPSAEEVNKSKSIEVSNHYYYFGILFVCLLMFNILSLTLNLIFIIFRIIMQPLLHPNANANERGAVA
jgi:NADH:ubiquinone oxidoreductase subunit 3 (subunit A)